LESAPVRPSIAALRFANLGGDPEQQYFADGMVEDVLTGLSRIKGLTVIARNSSFAVSSAAGDVRKTANELGARYVLEGSVRKSGDRVRVTAQLIEAESARYVWNARYDRKQDEIFALQDDLAMSVVAAIEPNLRAAEIQRVKRKRPDNLDAYDLLLRALPLIYPAMPDGAAQGLPLIERALAKEPDYAQAHAFAAWGHEIIFVRGGGGEDNRRAAIGHAEKALAHGRDDAIALSLGGFVIGVVAHDRVVARQAFEAALELSPSCALTYILGCVVYAIDAMRRGLSSGARKPFGSVRAIHLSMRHTMPSHLVTLREGTTMLRLRRRKRPCMHIRHGQRRICSWLRHRLALGVRTAQRHLQPGCSSCSQTSPSAAIAP
jgi:TolB-like protein